MGVISNLLLSSQFFDQKVCSKLGNKIVSITPGILSASKLQRSQISNKQIAFQTTQAQIQFSKLYSLGEWEELIKA